MIFIFEQEVKELKEFVQHGRDNEFSEFLNKFDVFPRFNMCTYFEFVKQSQEIQFKSSPEISDVFTLQSSVKIQLLGFQLTNSLKIHPIVTLDVVTTGPGKQNKKCYSDSAIMLRKDSFGMFHCYLKHPISMPPKSKHTFTFKFKLQNPQEEELKGLSSTQYSKSCPKSLVGVSFGVWREAHCDQLHVSGVIFC